jgi:hypothetical protein
MNGLPPSRYFMQLLSLRVRANAVGEANSANVGATLLWTLSGTPCTLAEFSLYTFVALVFIPEPDSSSSHAQSCSFASMRPVKTFGVVNYRLFPIVPGLSEI